jgi:hypothetical protein
MEATHDRQLEDLDQAQVNWLVSMYPFQERFVRLLWVQVRMFHPNITWDQFNELFREIADITKSEDDNG